MSRPIALAVAAVLAMLAIGTIDHRVTSAKVPGIPPECQPVDDPVCNDARNLRFEERIDRLNALEDGFEGRAWLYAIIASLGIGAALVPRLRAPGDVEDRRREASSLGVAAVLLAVLMTVVMSLGDPSVELPTAQMYFPCGVMAVLAGAAGVYLRSRDPGARAAPVAAAGAPWAHRLALGALALTALTVVLAFVFAGPQPDCGGADNQPPVPGWTDAVATAAALSGLGAVALGLLALFLRRWFVALVAFGVNPFTLILMIASTCAFY